MALPALPPGHTGPGLAIIYQCILTVDASIDLPLVTSEHAQTMT